MTVEKTFNILKYGYMTPTKAKIIISQYFEQIELEKHSYWSGWQKINHNYISYTHYMGLDVQYDGDKVLIEITARDSELNQQLILDITDLTPDEVLYMFDEYYQELYKICSNYEYRRNK